MFNMIDIGERAGSGIPNIFYVWREHGWSEPIFTEILDSDKIVLSLAIGKGNGKKVTIKTIANKETSLNIWLII